MPRPTIRDVAALGVALSFAGAVWAPLRDNYFFADDFSLMYEAVNQPTGRFLIGIEGGHLYVLRNLVVLGMLRVFGPDPAAWFTVVIATHLVNVALVFWLVRRMTNGAGVASVAATLWGVAPVQEGTLGWYSVYGQVLATTVLLVLLLDIERVARRDAVSNPRLALWFAIAIVETNLFGTGIGVALALPIVACLLLPATSRRRAFFTLAALWVVVPCLYVIQTWLWVRFDAGEPNRLGLYVTWASYVGRDAAMIAALFRRGIGSILVGVFSPRDAAGPGETLAVAAYAVAVVGALIGGDAIVRRRVVALLAVAAVAYALVAAGRAAMLSAVLGSSTTAAATPRYHYLATVPLAAILALVVAAVCDRIGAGRRWRNALAGAVIVGVAVGAARRDWQLDHHAEARRETTAILANIADDVAREPPGHFVYIPNRNFHGATIFDQPPRLPGWAAIFTIFHPDERMAGRIVRFVDARPDVLDAARAGRRSAALIVGKR